MLKINFLDDKSSGLRCSMFSDVGHMYFFMCLRSWDVEHRFFQLTIIQNEIFNVFRG